MPVRELFSNIGLLLVQVIVCGDTFNSRTFEKVNSPVREALRNAGVCLFTIDGKVNFTGFPN